MRYDFKCNNENCLHEFSVSQSIKDYDGTYICPECGSIATKDYEKAKPLVYGSHFDGAYGRPL